jgi:hypothetical protein
MMVFSFIDRIPTTVLTTVLTAVIPRDKAAILAAIAEALSKL